MKTYLYRAPNLKVHHHFSGLSFMMEFNSRHPLKTIVSCDLFIIIIIIIILILITINFFRVFLDCSECYITYTTRFLEICALSLILAVLRGLK